MGAAFLGHYYLGWFNSLIVKPGTYDNYGCQGLLRNLKDIGKVVKVDICTCCEKFTYYYGKYAGKESYKPTDSIYITEKGDKYYLPGDDGFIQYRLVVPKYDHQETFLKLTDMYSEVMGEDLKTYEAWSKIHPNTTKIHLYDHTEKDADVAPLWEKILIENGVKIRVCIPSAKALDPSWKKNGKIAFLENGELYHKPKGEKFYTELKTHKFGSPPYLSYADSLEK